MTKKRTWILVVVAILLPAVVYLGGQWREANRRGGQGYAEPFRIAGNFYYVGATDVTSFLIASPQGHVLIDGGYPRTPELIIASIKQLGFDIKDVKAILSSEPHYDQAGGIAQLQKASGAQVWASEPSAIALESGGGAPDMDPFYKFMVYSGVARYEPVRDVHRLKDGDTVRLGPIKVAAHITPGHTKGCTTWTFQVRDGNADLNVVHVCSLEILNGTRVADPQRYDGVREDYERTFQILRKLPVDVWVTSHARLWGRYRKFTERATAIDSVAPFIDREGYRAYIDSGEARFRRKLAEQEKEQ